MMKTNPENYAEPKSSQIVPLVIENLDQFCLPKEYVVSTIAHIYELHSLLTGYLVQKQLIFKC